MIHPPERENPRLLVCAKTAADRSAIVELLESSRFSGKCESASNLAEARKRQQQQAFAVIFMDAGLFANGLQSAFEMIQTFCVQSAVILITERRDERNVIEAFEHGVEDYLLRDDLGVRAIEHAINGAIGRRKGRGSTNAVNRKIAIFETQLERIFSNHNDSILILGKNHEIRFLNPAAVSLFEAKQASLIGEVFPFAVEEGEVTELEIPTSGDRIHTVELAAFELHWRGEDSLLILLRKIATDREAEQSLLQQQACLNTLLDSVSEAVILTDGDGRIEQLNSRAAKLLNSNQESSQGRDFTEMIKIDESYQMGSQSMKTQNGLLPATATANNQINSTLVQRDRTDLPVSVSIGGVFDKAGKRQGCVVVLREADDRASEMASPENDGLNSVGLLVGGIAHDFNNMLTVILGNIALARAEADKTGAASQKLLAAESAALQASSLSQQLLTFSREGALTLMRTQIPEIIAECAEFVLRGSNVDFKLATQANLWHVDADKGRISQVINNLLINSDQAMPHGGVIEIHLRNLNIRRSEVRGLPAGDFVCIEVKDTGTGISPENLKHVFTPYFTTKENGNGLGLASSYSIAKSHNGIITADSSLGHGSIFRVYLPRSLTLADESNNSKPKEKVENKKNIERGHGRILLMDDMEAMLMVAGEILAMLGYEVECCSDGNEAINAYKKAKESGNPFDAVVFDLTVPGGMGGEEAADILKEYDPDLIAIASSGYSHSDVMSDHKNSSFKAVVPKPYRIGGMSDALHSVLQSRK